MDFLDPKKRRAFHIRLIVGYILVAIVIGLGTVIIVYGANGYGINTKTGQIVQNGLFFADSKPGGAQIYLNGRDLRTTTSARLILPAGNYSLMLKKTGYRSWSRNFTLSEQSIARYVYPLLFPEKPLISNLKTYDSLPGLITQSPDQKWLLVQANTAAAKSPVFDEYDTSTLDQPAPAVISLSLPPGAINNYSAASKLTEVEWSSDNVRLLLRHDYSGGSEFIIFDRSRPEQSVNINSLFGISPSQVSLRDKKADQLYIFNQAEQSLQLADTGAKTIAPAFLKNVLAYKSYGKSLIIYITDTGQPADTVAARIWNNGQTYKLNEFKAGRVYLTDIAQFQGNFYYAAGSDSSDRINIYKNPLNGIKNPAAKALPLIALRNTGASKLKFSHNARFIGTQSGQNFSVYDIETQTVFQYPLPDALAGDMAWMDGHRFIGQSAGNILVMDYDGINKQIVAPSLLSQGGFFSRDYNYLLAVSPSDDPSKVVLIKIDMRSGADLPKKQQ